MERKFEEGDGIQTRDLTTEVVGNDRFFRRELSPKDTVFGKSQSFHQACHR